MHLEVMASATLETLDRFLRVTWLECCGHLSAFEIGGVRYSVAADMYEWDTGGKSMQVRLEKVLNPGQSCSYEYDFGSTTELLVKVSSEQEVDMKGRAIQILARNSPPIIPCDVCGGPATSLCPSNASMQTKDACVIRAQRIMHAVKSRSCPWSIHRALASVGIQVRTRRISGSQPFPHLGYIIKHDIIYIISWREREKDSRRTPA